MSIKVGDIILYRGLPVRLMSEYASRMRLSHFGLVRATVDNVILVKSVVLPELKIGDLVIVNDIPQDDKDQYVTSWRPKHEDIVKSKMPHKIDAIKDSQYFGLVAKINDMWFLPYHLEPAPNYDMI